MMDVTEARLNSHEQVCTLRYEMLCARIKRLENVIMAASGVMLTGMGGIIFAMMK
jgi:hypothetical protein